jgi:formylglycine-generating enzyme required for sulfatase activity
LRYIAVNPIKPHMTKATDKTPDPLGYDTYARTLWARIQLALNKDTNNGKLGDDPLVVGLFGEWGAGKSHLLKLIQNEAIVHFESQQEIRTDGGFDLTIPVFFQPWKYEHEKHLHVPILMHILDAYIEYFSQAQTLSESAATTLTHWSKKAAPWMGLLWRRVLVPAAESFAGQFSVKLKLSSEIEECAHAQKTLAEMQIKEKQDDAHQFKSSDDGLYFYRWHETLKQLTRPGDYPEISKDKEGKQLVVNGTPYINFVIFIDDLDRCLPEKAVQSLELIKTIFNVESFAFVLALDDEVIERGIGHRYQAYSLAGKKPEMPITGFEYLEKIVHLPFRLPALTQAQAANFIRIKELDIQKAPLDSLSYEEKVTADKRLFFAYLHANVGMGMGQSLGIDERSTPFVDVLLSAFDQYVPRKLIRAIELLYQVRDIANARGKGFHLNEQGDVKIDHRILFGLLLLQLFQPELFRVLRRRKAAMRSLLAAFLDSTQPLGDGSDVSESRLWQWASMYTDNRLARHLKASEEELSNELATGVPSNFTSAVTFISASHKHSAGDVYTAQQIRLPVAERLVAHLQIERHAFNPFKLLKQLSHYVGENNVGKFNIDAYLEFLSEDAVVTQLEKTTETKTEYKTTVDKVVALPSAELQTLFERLISSDLGVQGEVADLLDTEPYKSKKITTESAEALQVKLVDWLAKNKNTDEAKRTMLRGLQYLAPSLTALSAAKFWKLVEGCVTLPLEPNTLTEDPPLASLYCDVRSMLGQDDRFDASRFYLPKTVFKDPAKEPIIGFVRMEGGIFTSGHKDEIENAVMLNANAGAPFYMARSHTTVDQYGAFLDSRPHENEDLWDNTGWQLLTRQLYAPLSSQILPNTWREDRKMSTPYAPRDWETQRRVGSRAVHGVTWFQARAYARWLNNKLAIELLGSNLLNYSVCLPTELQWEFVAIQSAKLEILTRGNAAAVTARRFNLRDSNIGHPSVPGCFATNELGLWDVMGNLRQWQDGLYRRVEESRLGAAATQPLDVAYKRLTQDYIHNFGLGGRNDSDCVALRGGFWSGGAVFATSSSRDGNAAHIASNINGFRIVLAQKENNY